MQTRRLPWWSGKCTPGRPRRRRAAAGRVLLAIPIGVAGPFAPWILVLVHVVVPTVAALHLAQMGPSRFAHEEAPRLGEGLRWLLSLYAWSCLLVERLPLGGPDPAVRLDVTGLGGATAASAAARVVTGLPAMLVLSVLSLACVPVWVLVVAAALLLGRTPHRLEFPLRAALRAHTRYLVRQASLVEVDERSAAAGSP